MRSPAAAGEPPWGAGRRDGSPWRRALAAAVAAVATALGPQSAVPVRRLIRALPQLVLGACAGVAGAAAGAQAEPGALAEMRFHRFARSRRATP
jgi:hypothetical protein